MSKQGINSKLHSIITIYKSYEIYVYIQRNIIQYNMITNNENILKTMSILYNWTNGTLKTYRTAIKDYTTFQKKTLPELLLEAEQEEETIPKTSKRTIKTRLINYRIYLQETKNFSNNTIKMYIALVCKVYKHHDITVPQLPPIRVTQTETYQDIPTHQEIQTAILHSRTKMKALITFIASTGLRRSDVANLKIKDFMEATMNYHEDTNNILTILQQMKKQDMIIPMWNITDIKTRITHISFSSHESSLYIIQMLQERLIKEDLTPEDSLFGIKPDTISKNFSTLNNKLGMGWKTTRRHFHPHALRKFFATTLTSNDVDFLSTEFLLGHTLTNVQSSYYFANPERLRNKYVHIMDKLTFTMHFEIVDVDSREKRELEELRRYRVESNERIRKLEEMINIL